MLELHQHQMHRKAAPPHPQRGERPFDAVDGHQQQPVQIEVELLDHGYVAMRAEVAIAPVQRHHEEMVERAVEDVVAHVAPAGRGLGELDLALRKRGAHFGDAEGHQPRMAVRAAALVGYPVGAQIAFLEDMHRHPGGAGGGDRLGVDRAGVTVKDKVGHALFCQQRADAGGPVLGGAGVADQRCLVEPERLVAAVEGDAPDARTGGPEHPPQLVKKGPCGPCSKRKV